MGGSLRRPGVVVTWILGGCLCDGVPPFESCRRDDPHLYAAMIVRHRNRAARSNARAVCVSAGRARSGRDGAHLVERSGLYYSCCRHYAPAHQVTLEEPHSIDVGAPDLTPFMKKNNHYGPARMFYSCLFLLLASVSAAEGREGYFFKKLEKTEIIAIGSANGVVTVVRTSELVQKRDLQALKKYIAEQGKEMKGAIVLISLNPMRIKVVKINDELDFSLEGARVAGSLSNFCLDFGVDVNGVRPAKKAQENK